LDPENSNNCYATGLVYTGSDRNSFEAV